MLKSRKIVPLLALSWIGASCMIQTTDRARQPEAQGGVTARDGEQTASSAPNRVAKGDRKDLEPAAQQATAEREVDDPAGLRGARLAKQDDADEPAASIRKARRDDSQQDVQEPLAEDPLDRAEQLTDQIYSRTQSIIAPMTSIEARLERLRELGLQHSVPAEELAESITLAVNVGRVSVPDRVPDDADEEFAEALSSLRGLNDELTRLERDARTTRLAIATYRKEAEEALEEATQPTQSRRNEASTSRIDQLRRGRLEQRLDQQSAQAETQLESVPDRVRTLQWQLENPYAAVRSNTLRTR